MAGLYLVLATDVTEDRITAAADRLTFFNETRELILERDFAAVWVGHDDPALFGPAYDPSTGVRIITSGRVAWAEADWLRAEEMSQYTGGLSNRLLLESYLTKGVSGLERHNGAALLVVWDPRDSSIHVFTDHLGYHPAFVYLPDSPGRTVICTFADAIAQDPACSVTDDEISMAELLSAWRVTPPHTFYQEIKHPGAATHSHWNLREGTHTKREYWIPFQEEFFRDLATATSALAEATRESIRIRTLPRFSPNLVFISGGLDSRTIIFCSGDRERTVGFNMFDKPNKEAAISQRICKAAGVRYIGFQRHDDYYPHWHSESCRISGSMLSSEDSHYLGVREQVMATGAKTVLSGCTTDWVFKGYGLEKSHQNLFGRDLPFFKFRDQRVLAFLPNLPETLAPDVAEAVSKRRDTCFDGTPDKLATSRDRLEVESRRLRPICYAPSVSSQIMYRIFPYDTFLADRVMADCYSRIRPEWKLNSEVWAAAVKEICVGGGNIADVNFGWKVGASKPARLVSFAMSWLGRRITLQTPKTFQLASQGSWPNLGWYALHSKTLEKLWDDVPQRDRNLISNLLGSDPWSGSLADLATRPNYLLRILTVAAHLKGR